MDRDRKKAGRRDRERAGKGAQAGAWRAAAGLSSENANAWARHSGAETEWKRRAANGRRLDWHDQSSVAVRGFVQKRTLAPCLHRPADKAGAAANSRRAGTIALTRRYNMHAALGFIHRCGRRPSRCRLRDSHGWCRAVDHIVVAGPELI